MQRRGCVIGRVEEHQEVGNSGDLEDAPGGSRRTDHHELAIFPTQDGACTDEALTPLESRKSTSRRSTMNVPKLALIASSRTAVSRGDVAMSTSPRTSTPGAPFSGAASTAKSRGQAYPRSRHRLSITQAVIGRTMERTSPSGVLRVAALRRILAHGSARRAGQNASARVRSPTFVT